jgi:hypothetical protein
VEVTVLPFSRHEPDQEHMVDSHSPGPDVGEQAMAVGAAPVLIAAQCIPDTCDGAAAQPCGRIPIDGGFIRDDFDRDQLGAQPQAPRRLDEVPAGVDLEW